MAATPFYAQLARRQIDFIVENDDVFRRNFIKRRRRQHRASGFVHVCHRFEDKCFPAVDHRIGDLALELCAPGRKAMAADDFVHRHEADVVSVAGISRAGVSETDDKKHKEYPS